MKSLTFASLLLSILVVTASCAPKSLEMYVKGKISSPVTLGIRNLTVIHIDPNGKNVYFRWQGHWAHTGDAFHVPYEVIELYSGSEKFIITDRGAGNNSLLVNGTNYKFNSQTEQLLIRFGEGVTVEPGGNYQAAIKQYDAEGVFE